MLTSQHLVGLLAAGLAALHVGVVGAAAGEVKIAVAANFTAPVKEIAVAFEKAQGHKVVASFGATGLLYAQISQGAPFDVFLAADTKTPAKAIASGFAVSGTAYTYAVGRLVLFSKTAGLVDGDGTLKTGKFTRIAIANPATAPYGAAAVSTMKALGQFESLQSKIVQGNNIAQAFQFVDTGNAEVGFVALSQVVSLTGGSRWVVPETMHAPIAQDVVLLAPGKDNAAARAFLAFLKGPQARQVILKYGYGAAD